MTAEEELDRRLAALQMMIDLGQEPGPAKLLHAAGGLEVLTVLLDRVSTWAKKNL